MLTLTYLTGPRAGERVALDAAALQRGIVLGRAPDEADVHFTEHDLGVSRRHARLLLRSNGPPIVEDLGSRNGLYIDGVQVSGRAALTSATTLGLGPTTQVKLEILAPKPQTPHIMETQPLQSAGALGSTSVALLAASRARPPGLDHAAAIGAQTPVGAPLKPHIHDEPRPPSGVAPPAAPREAPPATPREPPPTAPRAAPPRRPPPSSPTRHRKVDRRVPLLMSALGLLLLTGSACVWIYKATRAAPAATAPSHTPRRVTAAELLENIEANERAVPAPPSLPSAAVAQEGAMSTEELSDTEQALEDTLLLEDHIAQLLRTLSGDPALPFADRRFVDRVKHVMPMFVREGTAYWRGYCRWQSLGPIISDVMEREMNELGSPRGRGRAIAPLAWVESSLVGGAESPVGAKGPWQFMKATWQRYEEDAGGDTRCDLDQATRTAAHYLHDIFQQCGDAYPFLAIAGYNAGEGRTCRLKESSEIPLARRNTFPFTDFGVLPEETRDYVPKFVAASFTLAQPEAAARIGARQPGVRSATGWQDFTVCDAHRVRLPDSSNCSR